MVVSAVEGPFKGVPTDWYVWLKLLASALVFVLGLVVGSDPLLFMLIGCLVVQRESHLLGVTFVFLDNNAVSSMGKLGFIKPRVPLFKSLFNPKPLFRLGCSY